MWPRGRRALCRWNTGLVPATLTCYLAFLLVTQVGATYRPSYVSPYAQRELFVLNLEDGYFGCQVNESTDFLQLFELSKLCDGNPECFLGSDEVATELKCRDRNHCHPKMPRCVNGVCLDNLCYCNDGFGGKGCEMPDENECKYRPCDIFSHCTNTMGSFYCSCFPGYEGDGFECQDINECEIPALAALCVDHSECCNLPGHYVCKCLPGFTGNATVACTDIDECLSPDVCGRNAHCENAPGSYACFCPPGFTGDPFHECYDVDECSKNPCGPGAICTNAKGGFTCACPHGYRGSPTPEAGCVDIDECLNPATSCGALANCVNTPGSFYCQCPPGYTGNPRQGCIDINECPHACGANTDCINAPGSYECRCKPGCIGDPYLSAGCHDDDECQRPGACGPNTECHNYLGSYDCFCLKGYTGNAQIGCTDIDECQSRVCADKASCLNLPGSYRCECISGYKGDAREACQRDTVNVTCHGDHECTANAICVNHQCQCQKGYRVQGIECVDVNECRTPNICGRSASCRNVRGSYECVCKAGYEKIQPTPQSSCRDINECLFQRFPCGVNAKCINKDGTYDCICPDNLLGDAREGCRSPCEEVKCGPHASCHLNGKEAACICDLGFTFDPHDIALGCIDINECDVSHGPSGLCGQGAICTNVPGSHHCSCPAGFTGDPFRYCEDVNECEPRFGVSGQCGEGAVCKNSLGSFSCICPPGFTGNGRLRCQDINECSQAFGPNGKCGAGAICTNAPGSYQCRCPPGTTGDPFDKCVALVECREDVECPGNARCSGHRCFCASPNFGDECRHPCDDIFCGDKANCQLDHTGRAICVCAAGFTGRSNSLPGCVDIDECTQGARSPCGQNAACRNTLGSYECVCPQGFFGDGFRGCISQEPQVVCSEKVACPAREECVSAGKTNQCICNRGYIRDPATGKCRDVNECSEYKDKSPCGLNAFCINLEGSYVCHCAADSTGDPYSVCYPTEIKCTQDKHCPGNTICIEDAYRGATCDCRKPFVRQGEYCILVSHNCSTTNPCPENQECIYTGPGYGFCICPRGNTLDAKGFCRDIDECHEIREWNPCGRNADCQNLRGSYECLCPPGYTGNPREHCSLIQIRCHGAKDCPTNMECLKGQCQCLPPYVLDGQTCRHPCEWKLCGQYATCELGPSGPECHCVPGCTGHAETGCVDVNECRANFPLDPNGPCAVGATCINLIGGFQCECPPDTKGDPYKNGCVGAAVCTRDVECPERAACDPRGGGACVDPCATALCGNNAFCIPENHLAVCKCQPGFTGNPTDLERGCVTPCSGVWCGVNAHCFVSSSNQGVCQCREGFVGNPWAGAGCYPDYQCSATRPCGPSQDCHSGVCIERCAGVDCGIGARCDKGTGWCTCAPFFIGDPKKLCVPVLLPPICIPTCGINSHCIYGTPNQCVCNPGYSGNPYQSCSQSQHCSATQCGSNANCVEGPNRVDCVCPAGMQGNPFIGCDDVNECTGGGGICGVGATCINSVGSFQCVCPAGTNGNPLFACSAIPNIPGGGGGFPPIPGGGGGTVPGGGTGAEEPNTPGTQSYDCSPHVCGPGAFCQNSACVCHEGMTGDPLDPVNGCAPPRVTRPVPPVTPVPTTPGPFRPDIPPDELPNVCEADTACPENSACSPDSSGATSCVDVCDNAQCGPGAFCKGIQHLPQCFCPEGFLGNPNDFIVGCEPVRQPTTTSTSVIHECFENQDCAMNAVCQVDRDNINRCIDVCLGSKCGPGAICKGNQHTPFCECPPGFAGDPRDLVRGCQAHKCLSDADCSQETSCQILPDGIRSCLSVCTHHTCGQHSQCIGKIHQAFCECDKGTKVHDPNDPSQGCRIVPANVCENSAGCVDHALCRPDEFGIKNCFDACENTRCAPNAQCAGKGHRPVCECLPGFAGDAYDFSRGCTKLPEDVCQEDGQCPADKICRRTETGKKDCIDACVNKRCGPNAVCVAASHVPNCECPPRFTGNPNDPLRGCQPDRCFHHDDCLGSHACLPTSQGFKDCIAVCFDKQCGPNSECVGVLHQAQCSCKPGFEGNGENLYVGCKPRDKCKTDSDCHDQEVCRLNSNRVKECFNPCPEVKCGPNSFCTVANHIASCNCEPGFTGDPYSRETGCEQVKMQISQNVCESDDECLTNAVCRPDEKGIKDCYDACEKTLCGPRATCIAIDHQPECVCVSGFVGNPYEFSKGCNLKHECEKDVECSDDRVCLPGTDNIRKCVLVCVYATCHPSAICVGKTHQAHCQCPPGHTGNPLNLHEGCTPFIPNVCEVDQDCLGTQVCRSNPGSYQDCYNACEFVQCGPNAVCTTTDHRAQCKCLPNTRGDPLNLVNGCKPPEDECQNDEHCPETDVCRADNTGTKKCVAVCNFASCGENTRCVATNHIHRCRCKPGYVPNPNNILACASPEKVDECRDDIQCPTFQTCKPNKIGALKCAEVCIDFSCSPNSKCVSLSHKGRCNCLEGFTGNPSTRDGCVPIQRNECEVSDDCTSRNDECRTDENVKKCTDVCRYHQCGPNAICVSADHRASCQCLQGLFIGDPYDLHRGCKPVECLLDKDCRDHLACTQDYFCKDPCLNKCGANAVCIAQNHQAICRCKPGYTGDAHYQGCEYIKHCDSSPCHYTATCLDSPGSYVCQCANDYIGNPYKGTDGCRHPNSCPNGDGDCAIDAACLPDNSGVRMCKNPCEISPCGPNAVCQVANHRARCVCPTGFRASPDPSELCVRETFFCKSATECIDSQACVSGQCRLFCTQDNDCAKGEQCVNRYCVLPCSSHTGCPPREACLHNGYCQVGCRTNEDCPSNLACSQNQCKNPCDIKGICGPNALCVVTSHEAACGCPPGFIGNPSPILGCVREVLVCGSGGRCPPGLSCISERCRAPCKECADGEICISGACFVTCTSDSNCQSGELCLNQYCQVGCRTESDCNVNEICSANRCTCKAGYIASPTGCQDINECVSSVCHPTAICENSPGSYYCRCPDKYVGDGFTGCRSPGECPNGDRDCPVNAACGKDAQGIPKCINSCESNPCGPNADCVVDNHEPKCTCPKTGLFSGDAYERSRGCFRVECLHDTDCPHDRQCLNFECENPCDTIDCKPFGNCVVRDRQAVCRCFDGYENKGRLTCVDVNECLRYPCHATAQCQNNPGSYSCICPPGLVGNPLAHPGCHDPNICFNGDRDCPDSSACLRVNGQPYCKDPCEDPTACGINTLCRTIAHRPVCSCKPDHTGDPSYRCEPVQCTRDEHCHTNEVCAENKCIDVCSTKTFCGHNTICIAKDHKHTCKCRDGYYGDPIAGCRRIISCLDDLSCPVGEFCKNSVCRLACKSDRDCGNNEACENGRCITVCRSDSECPQGYNCAGAKCVVVDRCSSNSECGSDLQCRSGDKGFNDCFDPCDSALCSVNAVCIAKSHTAVCRCREGYRGDPIDRGCEKVECERNEDCPRTQVCENYKCIDPCRGQKVCGPNAYCLAQDHAAICRCREEYEGDPIVGCQPIDYCQKRPCHPSAICKNKLGGADCNCPPNRNIGNPYGDPGCRGPNECPSGNSDCPPDAACVRKGTDLPMCKNPCLEPSICGVNALCRVESHQPYCYCPPEFTGNPQDYTRGCIRVPIRCDHDQECQPGLVCNHKRCKPPCREDSECASREICVQGHCLQGCREDPDCLGGEICIARKCIAGCRTNDNCLYNEACILNNCKNPCETPNVCGINAICRVSNHEHQCSCQPGFAGNHEVSCQRVTPICLGSAECPPGHVCQDGKCRYGCHSDTDCVFGEQCFNTYCVLQCRQDEDCLSKEICVGNKCQVGCRTSSECFDNLACVSNTCIDPCKGSATCGPNAECQVSNHRTTCSCPEGFVGVPNAYVGCIRKLEQCSHNQDCRPGSVCFNGFCRVICNLDRTCAVNERCLDSRCHVLCQRDRDCPAGEICDQNLCHAGCRSDNECPAKDSCINNQCLDPCATPTACGTNAHCRVVDHQKQCACPPGTSGDPYVSCVRVSVFCKADDQCGVGSVCEASLCRVTCSSDNACFDNEKCVERRCSVICTHDSACPDGYICEVGQCIPGCRTDFQCQPNQACINYQCRDPCASATACGTNAKCQPVDHRTLCSCLPQFTGDPQVGCTPVECIIDSDCGTGKICQNYRCILGCRSDQSCPDHQVCSVRNCQDPCQFSGTCGVNTLCKTVGHKALCSCPPGYTGNPILECLLAPEVCSRDDECEHGKSCVNTRCIQGVECRTDDECHLGHICEATKCFVGCRSDSNCPLDKKCHGRQCSNPCLIRGACGINAQCRPLNHRPECTCPPGYFGNPQIECRDSGKPCRSNAYCAIGEVCQNGQCIATPGCNSDNDCGQGQICENTKCIYGCRSHSDCDFTKACIDHSCQNPCEGIGRCGTNAECLAISHEAICRCPADYTGDPRQLCQPFGEECRTDDECELGKICIKSKCIVGCRSDNHCPFDKACIEGRCSNPCHSRHACGIGSLCRPVSHRIECTCPPSYSGDPKVQCQPGTRYQCERHSDCPTGFNCENNLCIVVPVGCKSDTACNPGEICENGKCLAGCRRDSDCTFDQACITTLCVNPCTVQNSCGRNAQCRPVVHRPLCSCIQGFHGNAYDFCSPIPPQPSKECIADTDCGFGRICEANRCNVGCRSNDNCPLNKGCVNRLCQDPCVFQETCGRSAHCVTANHHPVCSCPPRLTGDPYIQCSEIPPDYCVTDSDCGIAQICESSRCIDACRTDDSCPHDKACINSRCQNPCSFFGACGTHADCTPANHKAQCSCPVGFSGNAQTYCTIEERVDEKCHRDEECDQGFICEKGDCIEGCRTDSKCRPDEACTRRRCQDPCLQPGICGVYAACKTDSHRPVCTCLPGYVGDAQVECRLPSKHECSSDFDCQIQQICETGSCIIGCRTDTNCALEEACINRLCQNPCSFFAACGRNAICQPLGHKPECSCPQGFKGNPNVVCVPEVTPPECYKDSECQVGYICENNNCQAGCRHDNNCPEQLACINGQCSSPCLPRICGLNAECRPENHRPVCTCPPRYIGDPLRQCTLPPHDYCERDEDCPVANICDNLKCRVGCRLHSNCRFDEACIGHVCQNPCSIYGACGQYALCRPINHDRICLCPPGHTGDPRHGCSEVHIPPTCTADTDCPRGQICQKGSCIAGCRSDVHCPDDLACIQAQCQNPCQFSGVCGKDAICSPADHRPHCSCPSGFSGNAAISCTEVRVEGCRRDEECAVGHICVRSECIVGCRTHSNCPFDKACINRFCQDPCDVGGICGVNTHCRSVNHQAICTCLSGYTGDPLRQCHRIEYECVLDNDCGSGFVCVNHKCKDINECLQGRGPCALSAMCTNLPGSFRCSCPPGLVGDAYRDGCRQPVPRCTHNADCGFNEACNLVRGECYDVCTKPGVCGRKALCRGINHNVQCYCPSGLKGDPYDECVSEHTCGGYQKCPGNLQCLGDYCGCPTPFLQTGSFCILTSRNCTTNNPCNENERCISSGNNGQCVCPYGYILMKNGVCRDLNECEEGPFPCGAGAQCFNTMGSFRCQCPPNTRGDPYNSGCQLPEGECQKDDDCAHDKACDLSSNRCFDPCIIKWPCGHSSLCRVVNHKPQCACPPAFTGNPLVACYPLRGCKVDNTCPGNLICLPDGHCGCPGDFQRQRDFCILTSLNCTTTNPCPPNQECVYVGTETGFCVCPRGFNLLISGVCVDVDECKETKAHHPCSQDGICVNTVGSFECRCPPDHLGDPYREGCLRIDSGCKADTDCAYHEACDTLTRNCYDPCRKQPCGKNAVCKTENHRPVCTCPPRFTGDPLTYCLPILECGKDYQCPGNLVCLSTDFCGCPPDFQRLGEYCILTSRNCTTSNPCDQNEECIYTGSQTGFCVCPRGYELVVGTGLCKDIDECRTQPCAPGAICLNLPGSYQCNCPPGTIGDGYVRGCVTIDKSCRSDANCSSDKVCDVGTGNCISPCYVCGERAVCTVINHEAHCVCPPDYEGNPYDKSVGCYPGREDPDIPFRTPLPPASLNVQCLADGVQVTLQLDGFNGVLYVKGHSQDPQCRRIVASSERETIDFKVQFSTCGLMHVNGEASFILVIQKHPKLVTYRARAYHIKCVYNTGEKTITLGFNVSMITTSGTIANTGPPPTCLMTICTTDGREISSAEIGDDLMLKVEVQPDYIYGGFARSCTAKTMENEEEIQYEVTDANGCATDSTIFGNWEYDPQKKVLMARFNAFKFPSSNNLRFQCNIRVCFGSCPPVNCEGVDAYGKRRRRQAIAGTGGTNADNFLVGEAFQEGSLREEIMVQSNAILTLERKDSQVAPPTEGPKVEEIDSVCLPKLGLIISLVITTLLALVAVAVAISCWLMAYRRRPKQPGPLPHPTDFPNPLYTTPEPLAEPTPDYYPSSSHRSY